MSNLEAERAAPCPFCGADPIVDGKDEYLRIRCESCGVQGTSFYFNQESDEEIEKAERDAIAAWSRRTPAAAAIGEDGLPAPVAHASKGGCAFFVKWTDVGRPLRGNGIALYTAEQVRQSQREAVAADRQAAQAAFDASLSLAAETIEARNAEVADLRNQLMRQSRGTLIPSNSRELAAPQELADQAQELDIGHGANAQQSLEGAK